MVVCFQFDDCIGDSVQEECAMVEAYWVMLAIVVGVFGLGDESVGGVFSLFTLSAAEGISQVSECCEGVES